MIDFSFPRPSLFVIRPSAARAGIQADRECQRRLDSRLRGNDGYPWGTIWELFRWRPARRHSGLFTFVSSWTDSDPPVFSSWLRSDAGERTEVY